MIRVLRTFITCLLVLALPAFLISFGAISRFTLLLVEAAVSGGLVLWFFCRFHKNRPSHDFLFAWFAAFLIWLFVQAGAQAIRLPFFTLAGPWDNRVTLFCMFFAAFGLYLMITEVLGRREILKNLLQYWILVSAVVGVFYVVYAFSSKHPVETLPPITLPVPVIAHVLGVSMQPNNVVDLFFPGVFYALALSLYFFQRRKMSDSPQATVSLLLLNFVAACVILIAILTTKSRGGIIAFGGGTIFFFGSFMMIHRGRKGAIKQLLIVIGLLSLFLVIFGIKPILHELSSVGTTVKDEMQLKGLRSLVIGASWQLVKTHGWVGVGLGQFQWGWLYYHKAPFLFFPERSYNDLLWMWAELGLPGILTLGGAILVFYVKTYFTAMKTDSYLISYSLAASGAALLSYLIHSMADPTFYAAPLLWSAAIVLGVGVSLYRMELKETRRSGGPDYVVGAPSGAPVHTGLKVITHILILLTAVGTGIYAWNRLQAYHFFSEFKDQKRLEQASKLDPLNASYPAELANQYAQAYRKEPDPSLLAAFRKAIDHAIELNPMLLSLYTQRARFFWKARRPDELQRSFKMMEDYLPGFYLAKLTASAFYANASVETTNTGEKKRFELQAIKYFDQAQEINPNLSFGADLNPLLLRDAKKTFRELLEA